MRQQVDLENATAAGGPKGRHTEQPRKSLVPVGLAGFGLLTLIVWFAAGCRVIQGVADLPGQSVRTFSGGSGQQGLDPVILQQRLLRFADDYVAGMLVGIERLNIQTDAPGLIERNKLRLYCVGGIFLLATGPNAMRNLVDIFAMVTLTREMVEKQWIPGPYGESAQPMLEACRQAEANITQIAARVLNEEQMEQIRTAIAQWRQEHPDIRSVLFSRLAGFSEEMVTKSKGKGAKAENIFSLLMLDPFAGLDPAARELAETRLFAERALYLAQRMPTLLRWQMELLTLEAAETPALREIRSSSVQMADAFERTSTVLEKFPSMLQSERENFVKALTSQETELANLMAQVKATLERGVEMSDSVNITLSTFYRIQESLKTEGPPSADQPASGSEPFRVLDYAETAQRIDAAAEKLTELLRTLDQTLGSTNLTQLPDRVAQVVHQAQSGGRDLVDYAFRRALLLLVITCVLVFATALVLQRLRR